MHEEETTLRALLRQRHMSYSAFCREWNQIATGLDESLKGKYPGHAQYYRWLRGELANKRPYPDACRMLEAMFPGWSVEMLFDPYAGSIDQRGPVSVETVEVEEVRPSKTERTSARCFEDLSKAFIGRTEFMSEVPLYEIFESASRIRASGLSLNLLTQGYSDKQIKRLVEQGTRFQLLFLNPQSDAMKSREDEEGYHHGFLGGLTEMNIKIMRERVRDHLDPAIWDRFAIALSDDIVRYNIILVDDRFGVFQPYLPEARGVDSPTFVMETQSPDSGFFHIFDQVFTSLWKRATVI